MTITEILKWRQEQGGLNQLMNIHILECREGYAKVEIENSKEKLNPLGKAHGGTIYTLCDVAAGTAAASRGELSVTMSASINYYKPGDANKKLVAETEERRHGRSTATYFVTVHDETGAHLADATFTMFFIGEMVAPSK